MLVKMREFITCRLTGEVRRWEHKAKLDPGEPDGCGYPVCAIVDGRPKGPFIKDVFSHFWTPPFPLSLTHSHNLSVLLSHFEQPSPSSRALYHLWMGPKRFVSLCNFTAWMEEMGLTRRVFELQKGGCEDVSE